MQERYNTNTYYLVRHGEAENNILGLLNSGTGKREYPLTENGRQMVAKTAAFLRPETVDFIVSSPVLRARQTAEIIKESLQIPLSLDSRLCEAGFGSFEETSHQAFIEFMATHGTRAVGAPELGVEGYMDIRERVRAFLVATAGAFSGKKIVIVSHADTLQELYAELIGEPIGSEQGDGRWFPEKASCLIVSASSVRSFNPMMAEEK